MTEKQGRQIIDVPLAHYAALYEKSDVKDISARTGLVFNAEAGTFSMKFMGTLVTVAHPVFEAEGLLSPYEEILIIRYLLEGRFHPYSGTMYSYAEMPWGQVYTTQFNGRVIGRIAREFGKDKELLKAAVEGTPGLEFVREEGADAAYRFEFLDGLYLSILVWEGDDEFPASAGALFSDNFKQAFTAEDMAVAFDIALFRLKRTLKGGG